MCFLVEVIVVGCVEVVFVEVDGADVVGVVEVLARLVSVEVVAVVELAAMLALSISTPSSSISRMSTIFEAYQTPKASNGNKKAHVTSTHLQQ